MPYKNVLRVALITFCILLIPLVLQLTIGTGVDGQGWNWKPGDFVVIGVMIFIAGLLIDLALRRAGRYRVAAIVVIVLAFLWLWVELAVGLFTNWGS
jgi:hypothetical protein